MKQHAGEKLYLGILRFLVFFGLISFVVTCSFLLFLRSFDLDRTLLEVNAKATFLNIVFLTSVFWIADLIRRKLTVERPIKKIIQGLERITKGDFNAQIPKSRKITDTVRFNTIIDGIHQMANELQSVETLRTDFISNVSHELKTPLAVIRNYAVLLQRPGLSEQERLVYAEATEHHAQRLASLVTNILKLNKLENQQIFPKAEKFDLGEQLCDCLLQFEETWERKNIEISANIPEEVHIFSDPELLAIVWNNLVSNALKFTDPGGTVSVTLTQTDDRVAIRVSDTGCGMSAETGKHIFEKFYQGDTSHAEKGNGLGLALVKRVVDIVGGEITVQSEKNKGTTFVVVPRKGIR